MSIATQETKQAGEPVRLELGQLTGSTQIPVGGHLELKAIAALMDAQGNLIRNLLVDFSITTSPLEVGLSEQNTAMDEAIIIGYPTASTELTIHATYKALSATKKTNIIVG